MAEIDAVTRRVQKLLALATSSNVHEAAAAAARAQALIDEHRLDALMAGAEAEPITDGADEPLERARRPRKWRSVLASALAEANGCLAWSFVRGPETALCVLGRAADREAVRALWGWLAPRVEWLSATHAPGRDRAFHEAFRIGAVEAVVLRLRAPPEARGPGLVRLDGELVARREAVERYAAERLRLKGGRALRLNAAAYARGRDAADELPLPPVGGRGS